MRRFMGFWSSSGPSPKDNKPLFAARTYDLNSGSVSGLFRTIETNVRAIRRVKR